MIVHIGVTGTQTGMTSAQKEWIAEIFLRIARAEKVVLHHGDCVGADQECHNMASMLGWKTVAHPCDIDSKRANCKATEVREVKPPLVRNKDIVNESEIMYAFPKEMNEVLRSGTWATIRYARKRYKQMVIVYPDGGVLVNERLEHSTV